MKYPEEVVILAGRRTPFGKFQGVFKNIRAPDLGGTAIRQALADAELDPSIVGGVYVGEALTAGVGQNPARQAAAIADIPWKVPAETFNKVCASSVAAMVHAVNEIRLGQARFMIAGGMESMSHTPYLSPRGKQKMGNYTALGGEALEDSILEDGLRDMHGRDRPLMGAYADWCAYTHKITRKAQDDFAFTSFARALRATEKGLLRSQIIPMRTPEALVESDEGLRKPDIAKMQELRPCFIHDGTGTVTIATSSQVSDGAAMLVLAPLHRFRKEASNKPPLARIVRIAVHSDKPEEYPAAPVAAIQKILRASGLQTRHIDLFEINEAFAVVPLYAMQKLGIPHEKVNIWGGAIAIGHPLGASGARIVMNLAYQLIHEQKRYGIAAICNGGGEAMAVLIENLRL